MARFICEKTHFAPPYCAYFCIAAPPSILTTPSQPSIVPLHPADKQTSILISLNR